MTPLATGPVLKTAMALTAATAGAVMFTGTASAATPTPANPTAADTAVTGQASEFPLWDPRGRVFRVHFRTYAECVFFANHDGRPRTHGWDCRHGGDRNFPWEYWY